MASSAVLQPRVIGGETFPSASPGEVTPSLAEVLSTPVGKVTPGGALAR